jgi:hypothetical protein
MLEELALSWLATPRPADDPAVLAGVDILSRASDTTLARAVRDTAPSPAQARLYDAFAARDPDAALAIAGGSGSPVLRAQAIGQDEELRRQVIEDPAAPVSALYAALAIWRPGPDDPPERLERFLHSADPGVRTRAQQAKLEATATACVTRARATLDLAAAQALYAECAQPSARGVALERLRALDPAAASAAVDATLTTPETPETGVAAVRAAVALGRNDLLEAMVPRTTVSRELRREALEALAASGGSAKLGALAARHGTYLGYRPPETAAAMTADGEE